MGTWEGGRRGGSGHLGERQARRQWALGRAVGEAAVGTWESGRRGGSGHLGERQARRQWALGRAVGEAAVGKLRQSKRKALPFPACKRFT